MFVALHAIIICADPRCTNRSEICAVLRATYAWGEPGGGAHLAERTKPLEGGPAGEAVDAEHVHAGDDDRLVA